MISFKLLGEENCGEIIDGIIAIVPEADREEIEEILFSFSDCSDGSLEVAVSAAHGCVLLRIFDAEYLFPYPIALTDTADALSAADEIRLYSIKEEIPLVFIDVPSEELSGLLSLFRHTAIDAEDFERDSYTVRVESEIGKLEEIPSLNEGEVSLDALCGADMKDYARLSSDKKLNEYWGYDYTADAPDADDEYFIRTAYEEFARETALPLAVRYGGKFVGEAVIYAPDLQGGAECAIRLLPEYQGRGIGSLSLALLIKMAEKIGLLSLHARVMRENKASIALFGKYMEVREQNEENIEFCTYL